ncbi:MAG: hypothetical protein JW731_06790 [Bacteroidales bacterium]|nr:hypothetical protein [Bacteroidales bacterium]
MKSNCNKIFILSAIFLMAFTACKQVVVRVDSVPSNTPANQPVYITGNFNNWDPGDEKYLMLFNPIDSTWSINLPPGIGTVEYKFTRGDWTTVEKDICGYEIDNRRIVLGSQDTVTDQIASWNDLDPVNCPRITIVIDSIPGGTPMDGVIAAAGNFNAWNPNENGVFRKDSIGRYLLTIDRMPGISELEFKVTRGDLANSESDEFGNFIPNRKVKFGLQDTLEIAIDGWVDKPSKSFSNRVIFIINSLPKSTPPGEEFYLISNLNNWTPSDRNYIFQKNKQGQYYYPFPRKKANLEYKITRGPWTTVEVDRYGFDISNRVVNLQEADTVFLNIAGWKDLNNPFDYEVTLKIEKLPPTTPIDADFYLAGDISGWNPGKNRYRFQMEQDGNYYLNIPRGGHMFGFKITCGSWRSVEVDRYGSDIPNRNLMFENADTVVIDVANWKDIPPLKPGRVTLVINELPVTTPQTDHIYLAPDFNGWNPGDKNLIFQYLSNGNPFITLPAKNGSTEYKITRGNWGNVEVDENGNTIDNRTLNYGFADTVYIQVAGWRDYGGRY